MSYTFEGLNIGRSGIHAARGSLNVTGQNITNINTDGYTRQRVRQSSVAPTGIDMMYAPGEPAYGEGTSIDGTEQLRDGFLDSQYREQNAVTGSSSSIMDALEDAEKIFYTTGSDGTDEDDTSIVDVLGSQFSSFVSQLEGLTRGGSTSGESNIFTSAKSLATTFNTAAKSLDTIWDQQYGYLNNYAAKDANDLLKNIAGLNDQIKDSELAGSSALELKDKRNLYLDQLSQYCSIKVTETPTDVGSGRTINTMSIELADSDGNPIQYNDGAGGNPDIVLINGDEYAQFSVSEEKNVSTTSPYNTAKISVSAPDENGSGSTIANIDNSAFTSGEFSGYLKLLNESGEFDGTDNSTRGIGFYTQLLNGTVQKFAETINAANSTNDDGTINKPLFTPSDPSATEITAKNIRTSPAWTSGYLTMTKNTANSGDNEDASFSNIIDMITDLQTNNITIETKGGQIFSGTIEKSMTNIGKTLGIEVDSAYGDFTAKNNVLDNIESRRESISSVDIDDETVNLITYNQALAASARFITTVDECLNTIINNTGVAGR